MDWFMGNFHLHLGPNEGIPWSHIYHDMLMVNRISSQGFSCWFYCGGVLGVYYALKGLSCFSTKWRSFDRLSSLSYCRCVAEWSRDVIGLILECQPIDCMIKEWCHLIIYCFLSTICLDLSIRVLEAEALKYLFLCQHWLIFSSNFVSYWFL